MHRIALSVRAELTLATRISSARFNTFGGGAFASSSLALASAWLAATVAGG
jgi:hypothetical protein